MVLIVLASEGIESSKEREDVGGAIRQLPSTKPVLQVRFSAATKMEQQTASRQPLTRGKERAPPPGSCTPALRHPPPRSYGYVPSLRQTLPKAVTDTGSRRRLEMLLPIT